MVIPGFMRPLSHSQCWPRRSNRVLPVERPFTRLLPTGSTRSAIATGIHICAVTAGTIPRKSGGATPMTL